jgi:hypothetical protein
MDRFLAAINSNPPVISFCGFVEVNRGLITSVSIYIAENRGFKISVKCVYLRAQDVKYQ